MLSIIKKRIPLTFIILFIISLWIFYYTKKIFLEAGNNLNSLSNYSNSLINSNEVVNNNFGNFTLKIWWEKVKWSSLTDFIKKINDIWDKNWNTKIEIKILDKESWNILKVIDYNYGDFSYSINTNWIIEKIKYSLINWDESISLDLKNFVYIDNKKINDVIKKIKNDYKEDNLWQIYFDSDSKNIKVNNNKIYLTNIENIQYNIEKIDKKLYLKWSNIDFYLTKKENNLFKEADYLNNNLARIWELNFLFNIDLWDFSKKKADTFFNKNRYIYITNYSSWNTLYLKLNKWFLKDSVTLNSDWKLKFDEAKFLSKFSFLKDIRVYDTEDDIVDNPSLFDLKDNSLENNKPNSDNFNLNIKNSYIYIDYFSIIKEIKSVISKIDALDSPNLAVSNIIKIKDDSTNKELKIDVIDKEIINKSDINIYLKKWIYPNKWLIAESFINYYENPISLNNIWNTFCWANKNNISCDWKNVWTIYYNNNKMYLKNLNSIFIPYLNYNTWLKQIKKTWIYEITNWTLSLDSWNKFYNFTLSNSIYFIKNSFINELPRIIRDNSVVSINMDKLSITVNNLAWYSLLIKENSDSYYLYLFKVYLNE